MKTGKIKIYNEERGFGFIAHDDGTGDTFIHVSELLNVGIDPKREPNGIVGMRFAFDVALNSRTGKMAATNVSPRAAV